MKSILVSYERDSGQTVNFNKSGMFFSNNMDYGQRNDVMNILGVLIPKILYLPSMDG